jgi:hypothetical protein
MGSKDSLDLLMKLYYLEDTDIEIFTTSTIKNWLDYKKNIATRWFMLYSLPYILYMVGLNFAKSPLYVVGVFGLF